MMKFGLFLALLLLAPALSAMGQQPVLTVPSPGSTLGGNASSTIASTGVFQNVWAASPAPSGGAGARKGCTIQNNGTHNMYVSEGQALASATTSNTAVLGPGGMYNCNSAGIVLIGRIDITGTSGDAFYAAQE